MYEVNIDTMGVTGHDSDSSDEIEIIRELKVTLDEHQCDLCCKGAFLVDKLLQFGGLEHKYACEMCLESFKTKSEALKHANKHKRDSARSPVINAKTGVAVIEAAAISEASTSTKDSETAKNSTAESESFCCHICNQHCKSEVGLKRHNTNRHGLTHSCSVCGTNFKVLKEFKKHCKKNSCTPSSTAKLIDNASPKLLSCPSCQKNFLFRKSFKDHVCRLIA